MYRIIEIPRDPSKRTFCIVYCVPTLSEAERIRDGGDPEIEYVIEEADAEYVPRVLPTIVTRP
jgi:hypothetical protein